MLALKYTGFLTAARSVPILFLIGCASARGRVAVENCVIPAPRENAVGMLEIEGAECTLATGTQITRPFTLMRGYVCHPGDDYWKVLEAQRK
jgi:hypothetical protein